LIAKELCKCFISHLGTTYLKSYEIIVIFVKHFWQIAAQNFILCEFFRRDQLMRKMKQNICAVGLLLQNVLQSAVQAAVLVGVYRCEGTGEHSNDGDRVG